MWHPVSSITLLMLLPPFPITWECSVWETSIFRVTLLLCNERRRGSEGEMMIHILSVAQWDQLLMRRQKVTEQLNIRCYKVHFLCIHCKLHWQQYCNWVMELSGKYSADHRSMIQYETTTDNLIKRNMRLFIIDQIKCFRHHGPLMKKDWFTKRSFTTRLKRSSLLSCNITCRS